MKGKKFIISGVGCALSDKLYTGIDFYSDTFRKYLSRADGDGGLSPGKLVFTSDLEDFCGQDYSLVIKEISGKAGPDHINIGGPSIVSLIHASQLLDPESFSVRFYGASGEDHAADHLFKLLEQLPLDISNYIRKDGQSTPFTDVLNDADYGDGKGERTFVNHLGSARTYRVEDMDGDFFKSDLLCFGGTALVPEIHKRLDQLLKKSKEKSRTTIVNTVYDFGSEKSNPGEKWPLVSPESYRLIDVLIMDKEEALRISGEHQLKDAVRYFRDSGVNSFFITNGAEPVEVYSNGKLFSSLLQVKLPVPEMKLEPGAAKGDTTGCGDNFAGGLIASLAQQIGGDTQPGKLDIMQAGSWALASGTFACTYAGGTYIENHRGEKYELVNRLRTDYLHKTGGLWS